MSSGDEAFPWKGILKRAGPPKSQKRMIAVDIETHGLGGEFAGGGWFAEGEEEVTFFTTLEEWIEALFSHRYRSCVWYAHNGGEYDYKYILPLIMKRPGIQIHPIVQGLDRMIGFRIRHETRGTKEIIELRDSFALMPTSLAKLTESLAPEFRKQEFDHEHDHFNLDNPTHRAYLERDIQGLLGCLVAFHRLIRQTFHVDCGWTAGSTALKAWRGTIPPGKLYFRQPRFVREYSRQAYFGGMVALRDTDWHEDVVSLDVNAMYPYVMLKGVPCGCAAYTREWEGDNVPGIYQVRIHVPEGSRYPMAPLRDGNNGTIWPVGNFTTYLTSEELLDLKQYDCEWEVIDGIAFERIEYPFQEFVRTCEQIELKQAGSGLAMIVKIMRNALYGKFGAREEAIEWLVNANEPQEDKKGLWTPATTGNDELVEGLYWRPKRLDTGYLHPEWATWITSQARILNRHNAAIVGFQYWVYSDTDNNKLMGEAARAAIADGRILISKAYGASKIDAEYDLFRAGSPKFYYGLLRRGGGVELKAKGIPRQVRSPERALTAMESGQRQVEEFTSLHGTLQMLKRGVPRTTRRTRAYPKLSNSTHWTLEGTQVLPLRK